MPAWKEMPFELTYYGITDIYDAGLLARCVWPELEMERFHIGWPNNPRNDAFLWVEKAVETAQVDRVGFVGLDDELPPIPTGRTSPLTNAQVAAWLGYREFYFLGIDTTQEGQAWDREQGRTAEPRNIRSILECFERAQRDIKRNGGTVYDCTPGGRINREGALEYADLSEVLAA